MKDNNRSRTREGYVSVTPQIGKDRHRRLKEYVRYFDLSSFNCRCVVFKNGSYPKYFPVLYRPFKISLLFNRLYVWHANILPGKRQINPKRSVLLIQFLVVFNRLIVKCRFVAPKICRLCVCVIINKHSFEPFMCLDHPG